MAIKEIPLPEIGEGVTEGELVKWLVKPGQAIKADQSIAEVMTDKATVEVPSPVAGTVQELCAKEGDVIGIGKTMIKLETTATASAAPTKTEEKKSTPAPTAATKPTTPAPVFAKSAPTTGATPATSAGGLDVYPPAAAQHVLATPHTRRLAREMGVDINQLQGSGLAGRVTREDILKSGNGASTGVGQTMNVLQRPAVPSTGAAEERVPLRGIRKKIAENLQMAKHIIPHFTLMDEAIVTELVKTREVLKEKADKMGVKITYLPFIMKALIATIREFPMFNASIDDQANEIVYKKYFNIGFAADTPQGLLVPNIKNADQKTILQLSQEITQLAEKARAGKLSSEEMKHATITVTNIGSVSGTYATPIINHPEVAILGVYRIQDKPVWQNGMWVPHKAMNFTITADHRLIDGAVAANFLKAFIQRVQNPGVLMLDMI